MIDITNHRCPTMPGYPSDPSITRDRGGQWYLHQIHEVTEFDECEVSIEISHCPWCGKEL